MKQKEGKVMNQTKLQDIQEAKLTKIKMNEQVIIEYHKVKQPDTAISWLVKTLYNS